MGLTAARALAERLLSEATTELRAQGLLSDDLKSLARVHVRYAGTGHGTALRIAAERGGR